jgi:branched-chain amino acid aminotransferase
MAFHSATVDGGIEKTEKVWVNGDLLPWDECKVHVLTHALHYASAVFEGVRCYDTERGPAVFRVGDHAQRLLESGRVYRMDIPYTREQLEAAVLETIAANRLGACYVRPIAFRGYRALGVNPLTCPVEVVIAAFPWGKYLGKDAHENGVDVRVSSWTRMPANSLPAQAKTSANYANSALIKMEALADGYAEGIALDGNGNVSEGSGENIFLVRDGRLETPSLGCSVLPGITRDCVIRLARRLGLEVVETQLPRTALYTADEIFFTGTAAEITPIRSVDRQPVASGTRGPVTRRIQEEFFAITSGRAEDSFGWLTEVSSEARPKAVQEAR